VERQVLEVLARHPHRDDWLTVRELATEDTIAPVTRARVESVRRAVKNLERAGRVEVEAWDSPVPVRAARVDRGVGYAYRARHLSSRRLLCVHLPLSVEEKKARSDWLRVWLDRLASLEFKTTA
jgi:hypothetical protein